MTTLPGGWIADRLIGQRRAVLYGGILIACGHFCMAFPSLATFYLGLFLIVIGTGLLKGNVSVIVGQLYAPDDIRRDAGFSIFYMGINLGAFIAPLVCGYLGQNVNWHVGFAAAGVGMMLGLIQYVLGAQVPRRRRPRTPRRPHRPKPAAALQRNASLVGWPRRRPLLAVFGVGGLHRRAFRSRRRRSPTRAGVLPARCSPSASSAGCSVRRDWTPRGAQAAVRHRRALPRRGALLVGVRAGGLDAEPLRRPQHAQRRSSAGAIPSSWFQSLNSLFIWMLAPVFAWLWIRLGDRARSRRARPSSRSA